MEVFHCEVGVCPTNTLTRIHYWGKGGVLSSYRVEGGIFEMTGRKKKQHEEKKKNYLD
jgi:hypothetical protein